MRRCVPLLVRHGLAVYAQIQQTAGCNASHTVESRLARCLLQTHDLSGGCKLVLTQESMAQMIGARRNSVSLVANTLQQANFIQYSRGHIEIINLEGLTKTACECYAIGQGAVRAAASPPLPRRGSAARTRRFVVPVRRLRTGCRRNIAVEIRNPAPPEFIQCRN